MSCGTLSPVVGATLLTDICCYVGEPQTYDAFSRTNKLIRSFCTRYSWYIATPFHRVDRSPLPRIRNVVAEDITAWSSAAEAAASAEMDNPETPTCGGEVARIVPTVLTLENRFTLSYDSDGENVEFEYGSAALPLRFHGRAFRRVRRLELRNFSDFLHDLTALWFRGEDEFVAHAPGPSPQHESGIDRLAELRIDGDMPSPLSLAEALAAPHGPLQLRIFHARNQRTLYAAPVLPDDLHLLCGRSPEGSPPPRCRTLELSVGHTDFLSELLERTPNALRRLVVQTAVLNGPSSLDRLRSDTLTSLTIREVHGDCRRVSLDLCFDQLPVLLECRISSCGSITLIRGGPHVALRLLILENSTIHYRGRVLLPFCSVSLISCIVAVSVLELACAVLVQEGMQGKSTAEFVDTTLMK